MGCTSHCRSGLVEMAVTVGTKLELETARSVQKSCGAEEVGGCRQRGTRTALRHPRGRAGRGAALPAPAPHERGLL